MGKGIDKTASRAAISAASPKAGPANGCATEPAEREVWQRLSQADEHVGQLEASLSSLEERLSVVTDGAEDRDPAHTTLPCVTVIGGRVEDIATRVHNAMTRVDYLTRRVQV